MKEWIFEHYYLFAILVCVAVRGLLLLVVRTYRFFTVLLRGWPPGHLDADGDWRNT